MLRGCGWQAACRQSATSRPAQVVCKTAAPARFSRPIDEVPQPADRAHRPVTLRSQRLCILEEAITRGGQTKSGELVKLECEMGALRVLEVERQGPESPCSSSASTASQLSVSAIGPHPLSPLGCRPPIVADPDGCGQESISPCNEGAIDESDARPGVVSAINGIRKRDEHRPFGGLQRPTDHQPCAQASRRHQHWCLGWFSIMTHGPRASGSLMRAEDLLGDPDVNGRMDRRSNPG
jgi:hypothetical protein